MVVQVDNPANRHMHNGDKPVVTTLNAPDWLPKRQLYSYVEADRQFKEVQQDIYEKQKHTKAPDRKEIPKIIKILAGAGIITAGIVFRKNIISFFKNLFKKGSI